MDVVYVQFVYAHFWFGCQKIYTNVQTQEKRKLTKTRQENDNNLIIK